MRQGILCLGVLLVFYLFLRCEAQLVTPFMMCEWQCFKNHNLTSGVTFDDPVAVECRDYCTKHAYDHFGNLGTLG